MQRAAGIGTHNDVGASARDRLELAGPNRARRLGVERGICTPGAAAQPLVVELHQLDVRSEHRADCEVAALHVTEVAGILHGNPRR